MTVAADAARFIRPPNITLYFVQFCTTVIILAIISPLLETWFDAQGISLSSTSAPEQLWTSAPHLGTACRLC